MRPPVQRSDSWRGNVAAMVLAGAWLLIWRAALGTPWGFYPHAEFNGSVDIGILTNPGDTCVYLSFVQQYYQGHGLAGLLYTTDPHAALLWLFPLWLMGKVAAITGLSVIGIYNGAGVLGIMLATLFLRRAATTLGLSASARNWTSVALVLGSGSSWIWFLVNKAGFSIPTTGGDLFFNDLFPSSAFICYGYHALGLAALCAVWWLATEVQNRLIDGRRYLPWFAALVVAALWLGFSRPYEPVAFLGTWITACAIHFLRRKKDPAALRSALRVGAVLATVLGLCVLRTVWISRQPVWSTFANESLALGVSRSNWLRTLPGWALLVGLGARPAWRASPRLAALPLAASLLFFVVLVGAGGAHAKLASGLLIGPVLLGGWGLAHLIGRSAALPRLATVGFGALAISAGLGTPSLFLVITSIHLSGKNVIDPNLLSLARELPFAKGTPPPTVLTDAETGGVLPGLVGARVWAGHWSLTPNYYRRRKELQDAGLGPVDPLVAPSERLRALDRILGEAKFDFAILDRRCFQTEQELRRRGWREVKSTPTYDLLRSPRA